MSISRLKLSRNNTSCKEYYQKRFYHYGPNYNYAGRVDKQEESFVYKTAFAISNHQSGNSILDIGSGSGRFYNFLKTQGCDIDYTGLDINPSIIEAARLKYEGIKLFECDLFDYTIQHDVVFCLGVLGYENDMDVCIEKVFSLTKKYCVLEVFFEHEFLDTIEVQKQLSIMKSWSKLKAYNINKKSITWVYQK